MNSDRESRGRERYKGRDKQERGNERKEKGPERERGMERGRELEGRDSAAVFN